MGDLHITGGKYAFAALVLASAVEACGTFAPSFEPAITVPIVTEPLLPDLERQVFDLINDYRRVNGASPLVFDSTVAAVARGYSMSRAAGDVSSTKPEKQRRREETLCRLVPYREIAEQYATVSGDPLASTHSAVWGWTSVGDSAEALLDDFSKIGIAVIRDSTGAYHFTQILVRPSPTFRCGT